MLKVNGEFIVKICCRFFNDQLANVFNQILFSFSPTVSCLVEIVDNQMLLFLVF